MRVVEVSQPAQMPPDAVVEYQPSLLEPTASHCATQLLQGEEQIKTSPRYQPVVP
jgi:hypothetical protein